MSDQIIAAIILALGTLLGALIGRTDFVDRVFRRKYVADLRGEWTSTWSQNCKQLSETMTIKKVRGHRVYGFIESEEYPGLPCDFEGIYTGRFLEILWFPSKATRRQLVDDYGCYFFEKLPDGTFKGHSVGFFFRLERRAVFEHTLSKRFQPSAVRRRA